MWVYMSKDISVHSLYAHVLKTSQKGTIKQIGCVWEFDSKQGNKLCQMPCQKESKDRRKVLCVSSKYRLGSGHGVLEFELMTSRSWQYISCHWDACSNHTAISDFQAMLKYEWISLGDFFLQMYTAEKAVNLSVERYLKKKYTERK